MLPSDKILKELINKTSLKINSIDSFSKDYAKTLNIWNKEFNKKWDKIEKLGFDENFKLLWNYYLSYCEGGFLSKNIDLKQIKLSLDQFFKENNLKLVLYKNPIKGNLINIPFIESQ